MDDLQLYLLIALAVLLLITLIWVFVLSRKIKHLDYQLMDLEASIPEPGSSDDDDGRSSGGSKRRRRKSR